MDDDAAPQPDLEQQPARRRHGRWPAGWLRVVLFAAGVVTGLLGVGLLDVTTPDFAQRSDTGTGVPGGASSPIGGGAGAQAQVNAACLSVINDAQDVYAALGDLGPALDDQDLTALDDIVRRLQPVEPRLAEHLRDCRVDAGVGPAGSATPVVPTTAAPSPTTPLPATDAPTPTVPTGPATPPRQTTAPTPAPSVPPARPSTALAPRPTPSR